MKCKCACVLSKWYFFDKTRDFDVRRHLYVFVVEITSKTQWWKLLQPVVFYRGIKQPLKLITAKLSTQDGYGVWIIYCSCKANFCICSHCYIFTYHEFKPVYLSSVHKRTHSEDDCRICMCHNCFDLKNNNRIYGNPCPSKGNLSQQRIRH